MPVTVNVPSVDPMAGVGLGTVPFEIIAAIDTRVRVSSGAAGITAPSNASRPDTDMPGRRFKVMPAKSCPYTERSIDAQRSSEADAGAPDCGGWLEDRAVSTYCPGVAVTVNLPVRSTDVR